jgi:hypothetical protein
LTVFKRPVEMESNRTKLNFKLKHLFEVEYESKSLITIPIPAHIQYPMGTRGPFPRLKRS